jgi:hypothetical protein
VEPSDCLIPSEAHWSVSIYISQPIGQRPIRGQVVTYKRLVGVTPKPERQHRGSLEARYQCKQVLVQHEIAPNLAGGGEPIHLPIRCQVFFMRPIDLFVLAHYLVSLSSTSAALVSHLNPRICIGDSR